MLSDAQVSVVSENVYFAIGPFSGSVGKMHLCVTKMACFCTFIGQLLIRKGYLYDSVCCAKWLQIYFTCIDVLHPTCKWYNLAK